MTESKVHNDAEMKGWLSKWTNYIKGYQRRWFVLSNGMLSYYRNQAEMAHTCRGTISLHGALIHTEDSCTFVISNGGTQTFHIRAANEVERQRWVTALELAKAKAIHAIESEDEEEDFELSQKNEMANAIKDLAAILENLQTCNDLITKHGAALQRSLSELETIDSEVSSKVNERATLFRITSNAMINTCSDYLELAQSQGRKWQRILQHERDHRMQLEEMVEQLARQHSLLEQAAKDHRMPHSSCSHTSEEEEDDNSEFYDAQSEASSLPLSPENKIIKTKTTGVQKNTNQKSEPTKPEDTCVAGDASFATQINDMAVSSHKKSCEEELNNAGEIGLARSVARPGKRRTRVPNRPNSSLNLWNIMKNCIGKELSKIPMPVNFSEPLSMLQRLAEDFEYSYLLDQAAACSDSCEQLAYVAAFTVSSYSNTAYRIGKPFNPLLGETYECDRTEDLGWKLISEQVSHHPPMVAQYCEGKNWICWQEFTMASKFRGKYLQVVPLGIAHLQFPNSGNHYTWRKVTTTVHNIIVGKLWVDQHGEMDIVNHKDGSKSHLTYIPYSYFTRDVQRKVTGCVMDSSGLVRWVIRGTWDGQISKAEVIETEGSPDNPNYKTKPPTEIWKRTEPPPDSHLYYNFTLLACQLNEMEEGIAPTDSRLRPDQRLMEEGKWQEANVIKQQLEEKQRTVRRQRENIAELAASDGEPYHPYEAVWFKKEMEPTTGTIAHVYKGGYWECKEKQDWSSCPSIF